TLQPSPFLRLTLLADAVVSGATGLLLAVGAGLLTGLLNIPEAFLRYAGISLLPFAALVGLLATRDHAARSLIWAVIVYNALWALDSVLVLATGWLTPHLLGQAFVLAQALVVGAFAVLQYLGIKRSSPVLA
ncbi:MAG: hypothetical protein KIT73_05985, partial [Burkholderiales bacterium]|nr:hypothetical protein [Burkholderiales bacterium]